MPLNPYKIKKNREIYANEMWICTPFVHAFFTGVQIRLLHFQIFQQICSASAL